MPEIVKQVFLWITEKKKWSLENTCKLIAVIFSFSHKVFKLILSLSLWVDDIHVKGHVKVTLVIFQI